MRLEVQRTEEDSDDGIVSQVSSKPSNVGSMLSPLEVKVPH